MSLELDKYRALYFSEAQEQLASIHRWLDALGDAPADRAPLNAAFRAAHTLKAMSATMGYGDLTRASHALEDLLARVRTQNETPTDLTLRLLRNAAEDIQVRLRRAETAAVFSASDNAAPVEPGAPALASPLAAQVRVRQQDLNLLLELIAELVGSSNVLENAALYGTHFPEKAARSAPGDTAVGAHRALVRELRQLTWQLNMAPIGPVFDRYARILTELARQQNKTVRVVTQGLDVELCHAMLDELNEPLLHLLRNAITHGIEHSAERTWGGKDAAGTITLRAQRSGDRVLIQVADDGRGMDAGAILQHAYAQGLVSRERRNSMNANEALRLILLPNFSMAHTVTQHAGRGIGMSVAQERLSAVGGTIDIRSDVGHGTVFTLDVPRLVGLIEVELVRAGAQVYAIPTSEMVGAQVWMPAELTKKVYDTAAVLDIVTLKPVPKAQLAHAAGVSLIELQEPPGVMLRVDEFLGKALLNYPFAVRPASIPILDPAALFPNR